MILESILFQLVIPLLLLVIIALGASSMISLTLRSIITLGYLLLMNWMGHWLVLPVYLFHLYLTALCILYGKAFFTERRKPLLPGRAQRFVFPLESVLTFLVLALCIYVYVGRQPTGTYIVDLVSPIPQHRLYVLEGGSIPWLNVHRGPLPGLSVQPIGNRHAVDLVVLNREGRVSDDWYPRESADYAGFNVTLHAPCEGRIERVSRDYSDQVVNERTEQVLLSCRNYEVLLGHLIRGSTGLREGDRVLRGQELGRLGSIAAGEMPFLHLHVQRRLEDASGAIIEPVQLTIDGSFLVRGHRIR